MQEVKTSWEKLVKENWRHMNYNNMHINKYWTWKLVCVCVCVCVCVHARACVLTGMTSILLISSYKDVWTTKTARHTEN
jgi:hypothetical protein